MNKRNAFLIAALASGAIIAATALWAQPEGKGKGPCRADAERLCKGVEKGKGRIRACLKEKESELSDACRQRIQMRGKVKEACKADKQKLCKGKRKKDARQCMKENKEQLSAACRAAIDEAEAMRGKK